MRTHSAVGLTTTVPTTLIGSLGEEDLLAITQDRPAITQVENPNLGLCTVFFPVEFVDKFNYMMKSISWHLS